MSTSATQGGHKTHLFAATMNVTGRRCGASAEIQNVETYTYSYLASAPPSCH